MLQVRNCLDWKAADRAENQCLRLYICTCVCQFQIWCYFTAFGTHAFNTHTHTNQCRLCWILPQSRMLWYIHSRKFWMIASKQFFSAVLHIISSSCCLASSSSMYAAFSLPSICTQSRPCTYESVSQLMLRKNNMHTYTICVHRWKKTNRTW